MVPGPRPAGEELAMVVRCMALVAAVLVGTVVLPAGAGASTDGVWDYRPVGVSGSYQSFVGDFGGDSSDDILWYGPGSASDSLWIGHKGRRGASAFTHKALTVRSTFVPVVGDFAGDDRTDVLWYTPGTGTSRLWVSKGDGTFTGVNVPTTYRTRPYTLTNYTAGKDGILWYDPSSLSLSHRSIFADDGSGTEVKHGVPGLPTAAKVATGDWNGDGLEDAALIGGNYGQQGLAINFLADGRTKSRSYAVREGMVPVVIYEVPKDGLLWFGPGTVADGFWRGKSGPTFDSIPLRDVDLAGRVTTYPLNTALITGRRIDDVAFYDDGTKPDFFYLNDNREMGDERPIVGDFDSDGYADILWYAAGSAPDQLWYVVPSGSKAARALRVVER